MMRDLYKALAEFEAQFEKEYDLSLNEAMILCALQEAKEEIAKREAGLLAEETDGKSTSEQSSSKNKTSKTDTKSKTTDNARTAKIVVGEYSFDNPNGENIFLPVSANTGELSDLHGCL